MQPTVRKHETGEWLVEREGRFLARLVMDPLEQVEAVIIAEGIEHEAVLACARLAFSHAAQFLRHRPRLTAQGMLFLESCLVDDFRTEASDAVMRFERIPDGVRILAWEELLRGFRFVGVGVRFSAPGA